MECPRRRNITYKETGEIWFMTVRVMRFLPGMSIDIYFSSSCAASPEMSRNRIPFLALTPVTFLFFCAAAHETRAEGNSFLAPYTVEKEDTHP